MTVLSSGGKGMFSNIYFHLPLLFIYTFQPKPLILKITEKHACTDEIYFSAHCCIALKENSNFYQTPAHHQCYFRYLGKNYWKTKTLKVK